MWLAKKEPTSIIVSLSKQKHPGHSLAPAIKGENDLLNAAPSAYERDLGLSVSRLEE